MTFRSTRWFLSLAPALALAACGGETSDFDAVALQQTTGEVVGPLQNSAATQSLSVLGDQMTASTAAAAPALLAATLPTFDPATRGAHAWGAERVRYLAGIAGALGPANPAALFPDDLLGMTFAYDVENQRYVLSDQTGAPANGVRFILYAVNLATGQVVTPLSEIGYVDLTDKSTASATTLGIKGVINGQTLLEYDASAVTAPTSIAVSAVGFISDGTTIVDFDLQRSLSSTAGISINYGIAVPEKDVSLRLEASSTLQAAGSIRMTIQHAGNTSVIQVQVSATSLSGTITHNGKVVVNISGTLDDPVFTDPSGKQFTQQQTDALEDLGEFIEDILEAFDGLLGPALRLFGVPL